MSSTTDTRSRKRELRKLNQDIWEGKTGVFAVNPPLDTSFKKNTAVIKKFRTSLTPDNTASLLKDIATVSLEKYLPEVISAVSEGLLKVKIAEISTAVEVVSALHQRFGKAFTPFVVWNIAKGLSTPGKEQLRNLPADQKEKEETTRLARQRLLLRVATELWLVGVIRTLDDAINPDDSTPTTTGGRSTDNSKKQSAATITRSGDDEPLPLEALKDILSRDREGVNLPLVVLFVKTFSWDVLGVKVRTGGRRAGGGEGGDDAEPGDGEHVNGNGAVDAADLPLADPTVQIRFRNVLSTYFSGVSKYIHGEHRRLQQQAKRNSEAYVRSGEVFEDRQQAFEKATKAHEKLVASAQVVSEILGLEMPDLSDDDEAKESGEGMIRESGSMFKKGEEASGNGMWEDDDQRRLYEDLIDLRARVPSILLDEGRKASTSDKKEEETLKTEVVETGEEDLAAKVGDLDLNESLERDTTIANKTVGAQVDALLIRLPELTNRELIDNFAYDFCFLNSKASRNRLIKVLEDIPRGRSDLLPYYSRLIASLSKAGLTDVSSAMVVYLDKEFRSLQKRKEKEQLTAIRTQNAKYFSEMTKFGLVPEHVIFHCFKVALEDFSKMNIDIICILLEGCGRYLLRNPATQPRMITFLETLQRKKDAHHLSPQDRIAIENAFYYVNPPERPSIVAKERSPYELYVRKLIYLDLNKKNFNRTIKSLRKLHWEDPSIVNMLAKVCTKIWKVRYSNVSLIAIVVFGLFRYHQDFGIRVVDGVLENIRIGLEENDYRMNQRRIASIRYLGDLYNYSMIDSPVIFDTLYLILSFGYAGTPQPGMYNHLDPPDNHFRIRLVCTLLDTCGHCFDRGSSKKKLDFFLAFFQYYIHLKERIPMDIEFMIQDTFQLVRPNWILHTSLEEAGKAFQEATAKIYGPAEAADDDSSSNEDAAGSDGEDVRLKLLGEDMDIEAGVNEDEDSDSADESSESGDMDEGLVYSRPQEYRDPEAEADFDREFAKLMAESLESRKFERKTVFDVPLPIKKSIVVPTAPPTGVITMSMLEEEDEEVPLPPQQPGIMKFSLLTKRGNKQQTRDIELPSDSTFAVAMKSKQEQEREERQRIKDRVLHYERMEEDTAPPEPQRLNNLSGANIKYGANVKYGDKGGASRGKRLQLGDFNWYGTNPNHPRKAGNPLLIVGKSPNILRDHSNSSPLCKLDQTPAVSLLTAKPSVQQTRDNGKEQLQINVSAQNCQGPLQKDIVPARLCREKNEDFYPLNGNKSTITKCQGRLQHTHAPLQQYGNTRGKGFAEPHQNPYPRGNSRGRGGNHSYNQLTSHRGRGGGFNRDNYTGRNSTFRGRGNGDFSHQQPPHKRLGITGGDKSGGHNLIERGVGIVAARAVTVSTTKVNLSPPPPISESQWPELGKN
ncbi:hypothetical protein TWF173_001474 [Orbilia oligospora]|nr:hypothetical protein TWF173_001474 [Orbilia oligospora]